CSLWAMVSQVSPVSTGRRVRPAAYSFQIPAPRASPLKAARRPPFAEAGDALWNCRHLGAKNGCKFPDGFLDFLDVQSPGARSTLGMSGKLKRRVRRLSFGAWRVATRCDDGDRGMRTVEGNGVCLTWHPPDPVGLGQVCR